MFFLLFYIQHYLCCHFNKICVCVVVVRPVSYGWAEGTPVICVCVCVCDSCCEELSLQKNMKVNVEIQFQMNRLIFSQLHYAIDELDCTELLFPDHNKVMRSCDATASRPLPQSVSVFLSLIPVHTTTSRPHTHTHTRRCLLCVWCLLY